MNKPHANNAGLDPLPLTRVLKPARPGLIVRDPKTLEPLADKGQRKPLNAYWNRRLRDGDVVDPEAEKAAAKKTDGKKADSNE